MSATAASSVSRAAAGGTKRLMVRMNGTLFHCLGAALLLEAAVVARHEGTNAGRSVREKGMHEDGRLSERRTRVQWLRDYVSGVWPEFDWDAACKAMETAPSAHVQVATALHPAAAVARALNTEHAAMFYGALGRWADDSSLRAQLEAMSAAESSYARASKAGAPGRLARPLQGLRRLQAARAHLQILRDCVVRRAYEVLQQHWTGAPVFPTLSYDEFLARAYALTAPHLRLDWAQRMLLRAWTGRARSGELAGNADSGMALRTSPAPQHGSVPTYALPQAVALR